jgi:oligosaccharide 4-alpha-D-glucosyltransferase
MLLKYKALSGFLSLVFLLLITAAFLQPVYAQLITTVPENPGVDDEITLVFNAAEGNRALFDYQGDVYFHTGLITSASLDQTDWKKVVGNWGTADERVKMTPLGNNLFEFRIQPRSFYSIGNDVSVHQIAFVFRTADGTLTGKTTDNQDILLPLKGYKPSKPLDKHYLSLPGSYKNYSISEQQLVVHASTGDLTFRTFSKDILEVSWHVKGFHGHDSSHAVILEPSAFVGLVEDRAEELILSFGLNRVVIAKEPLTVRVYRNEHLLLSDEKGFFIRTDARGIRFSLAENEKIYGTGERATSMNLRGDLFELYNRPHYGYELGAKNLNYSLPVLVSSQPYLMLVDNPQKAYLDIDSKGDGVLEFGTIGGPLRYYLVTGDDYPSLMKTYGQLTGTQPMPPLWALGNLQSRMAYKTQEETISIVNKMQEADFPIDAIIIDFYWFGDSILGHVGRLDWFTPNWPEPESMIRSFREKGVKTILITEPYIIDTLKNFEIASQLGILATDSLGNTYVNREFYFGDAGLIDMFNPAAGDWFWDQIDRQNKIGVAGWWGDLGEPESHPSGMVHVAGKADEVHNIFAHYWHKIMYDKFREHYPGQRLFNLNRSGYAGSQRYSIFPWTGDVSRSWGGLQAQLPAMLHMSLSGLPYIHADAGGFALGTKDDELYTRWLQFAAFTPILRPHGSGVPSEPIFFNDTTQRIVRRFMKQRYELLPYIYTLAWETTTTGLPITRPLFFHHPNDSRLKEYDQAYFFGSDLIVAPIVEQGIQQIEVPLPEGIWYNWWTGEAVGGGNILTYTVDYETIPVFARGGAIIPHTDAVNSTDAYSSRRLYLNTYLHTTDGPLVGRMYEDDGWENESWSNGTYELLSFTGKQSSGNISIVFDRTGKGYAGMPESRMVELTLYGLSRNPGSVTINGRKINAAGSDKPERNMQAFWKDENNMWRVRFVWDGSETHLLVE